ncbi:DEAD/DEAH box helicase [candidate division WOR-3 bacterium]|uniref:DEAD/DEAH box helicase n=1 Tax=candidate division WOR-3 bacterium TaxID=2052148 RepID=A0A938BS88_UNCW3|nr:DEAD/DEAH box helicase [candidate division WOR-3 bacterium]
MPDILSALDDLRRERWYSGQISGIEPLPSRTATYAEPDPPLPKPLADLVGKLGIPKLYKHQVELLGHARAGRNVIITTATASGKTLAFNLPVFETMLDSRSATALYLYPMKAVTQDQLKVIRGFERGLGLDLRPAVYDGDTPADKRSRIRQRSRIVLSNPYELHQILPYHYQWQSFYRNLRYCIIDEAHTYRGVFGSNVAQLLRRFRRICAYHGSDPQFFLASASIANPLELAEKLTGKEFALVGDDGAPRGRNWLVFWNPLANGETSIHAQTQQLVAHFAKSGFQTVCFVQSRRLAELISRWVKEHTPELAVSPYRAGYVPEDRRAIEAGLASGALRGVVSTNALELGIDIGSLDCIVIAGFPGSFASFWQQAGRAGRKLQDSVVVFVGYADALNQYLLRNPGLVLERGFEAAVVDLENPYIISGHLACAASELPLRKDEVNERQLPAVKALEEQLVLRRTPVGWIYAGRARPQEEVTLDAIEESAIEIVADGRVIETMDRTRAFREAYPGAVLLHQGETYLVKTLDLEQQRAEVERKDVDFHTEVITREEMRLLETQQQRILGPGITLSLGRIEVTATYTGYRIKKYDQLLATHPLSLPPVKFPTVGIWLVFSGETAIRLQEQHSDFTGGLHAAEHALIALAPLVAMCDPRDIGGGSYRMFPDTRLPTILIYDGYEHGIGISEKLYSEFDRLSRVTRDLVMQCACDTGCPACVLSPRCGDANEPIGKQTAVAILSSLQQA